MLAYRELPDEQLFSCAAGAGNCGCGGTAGPRGERFNCPRCGESVNFGRFAEVAGQRLCLSCARPDLRYWTPDDGEPVSAGEIASERLLLQPDLFFEPP